MKLKEGCDNCVPEESIEFCGERLPKYMVPHSVVFGDLPVNSTGKIQKFVLREKAKTMGMQNGSLKLMSSIHCTYILSHHLSLSF